MATAREMAVGARGSSPASARAVPGDGILHPVVLGAIALLLFNDHALKAAWPGVVAGKLSDIAGVLFFPLLLQGCWEVATAVRGRAVVADARVLAAAIAATGVVFASVKLSDPAAEAYRFAMGALQWAANAAPALLAGAVVEPMARVELVRDPTDLVALLALAASWMVGSQRTRRVRT